MNAQTNDPLKLPLDAASDRPALDAALLTRREAIFRVSVLLGSTAFVGQAALLSGCATQSTMRTAGSAAAFTDADIALLAEIADTILPETETPGAKAAGVGSFMAVMVRDTYETDEQETFRAGMQTLEEECLAMHGVGFTQASAAQRTALLERLDAEQMRYMGRRSPRQPVHYFRMMKELALMGYFTSEVGYTQAMRYIETPGRFDACAEHAPGDKIWASHA